MPPAKNVDEYIALAPEVTRAILQKLRRIFLQVTPKLEESIKWGVPFYSYNGLIGGYAAYSKHVSWAMFKGEQLTDPDGLMGQGIKKGGKIAQLSEMPPAPRFTRLIKEAIALNETGVQAKHSETKSKLISGESMTAKKSASKSAAKKTPSTGAKTASKKATKTSNRNAPKTAAKRAGKTGAASADASKKITERAEKLGDWRGETLEKMRQLILASDPDVVEEWKWQKATSPGVPVWSHDGIICTGETYKEVVKLTFAKGASLDDPNKLFNASLEGGTRRAIDIREGEKINEAAFKKLIKAAVVANSGTVAKRAKKK